MDWAGLSSLTTTTVENDMENYNMDSTNLRSKGFTLIATLLLLLLLSGIAIGMLMMVSTEAKVGTQDVQNNTTFHAAEGAIEKMTSDLAGTFQNI
jgi:Tfp pilus assembly protein PilX